MFKNGLKYEEARWTMNEVYPKVFHVANCCSGMCDSSIDAYDLAQEVLLKGDVFFLPSLRMVYRVATCDIIDYIRVHFGRNDSTHLVRPKHLSNSVSSFEDREENDLGRYKSNYTAYQLGKSLATSSDEVYGDVDSWDTIELIFKHAGIKDRNRKILLLRYRYGYKQVHIAELFHLSESGVSYLLTKLRKKLIKAALEYKDSLPIGLVEKVEVSYRKAV